MDLYEKIKALNSKREFEPLHRSTLTKTMIDKWHNERNSVIENWHINSSRKDDRELKVTERPIVITYKDNKKDFDERKDYSQEVQKMIEVEKVRSSIEIMQEKDDIERQENNNRKDDIIETIQKKKIDIIDGDKERKIERQQGYSILTNSSITLHKELNIGKDIVKERNMIMKEKEDDSLVNNERTNNSLRNNDSSKKCNSFKEEIDERLKSIEKTMDNTRDNSLVELAKKIEILNSPIEIKEMKKDITVLEIIELLENEKSDKYIRNIICHKCKEYGHTKKQCDRHNKIIK